MTGSHVHSNPSPPLSAEDDPVAKPRGVVLIVTADSRLSDIASDILHRNGYEVLTAAHAGHAILAGLTKHRIDTLIAELHLDDMPGATLAATLRRHHPELRSFFLAHDATSEEDGILVRPFTTDELLAKINSAGATAVSSAS